MPEFEEACLNYSYGTITFEELIGLLEAAKKERQKNGG